MKLGKSRIFALMLLVLFMVSACAWFGAQTKLVPKQQATIWMDIYNATYDDILSVMRNPAATVVQKDVAQKKRAVLIQVWPLLKVYVSVVSGGGTPSIDQTAAITDLINQLAVLAGGV